MRHKTIKITLLFTLLLALVYFIFLQFNKESLHFLPQSKEIVSVTEGQSFFLESRTVQQFAVKDSNLGLINLAVSFPNPLPNRPLPILFILGGLETGLDSVRHVSNVGNNILIGYDWPIQSNLPEGFNILLKFPRIYKEIYHAPGQITAAIEWIAKQRWAEIERISVLGFSVGAIVAPAVQHLLERRGTINIGWTVLAYGGADIGKIVNYNPSIRPNWIKPLYGWIIQLLFNPLDPKEHLPFLSGKFLLVSGTQDEFIPKQSSSLMQKITPQPKDIIFIEGQHMGVGENQKTLLSKIIEETRIWLKTNGAINP